MKKLVIYLFAVMAIMACEPIVDDVSIGGVIPESELNLTVKSVVEGGNELVLENNTPGVGSLWDFMIAKSSLAKNVIVLPFMGEITITFTGICDGGTVTTTRTVNVTKITTPVAEEWNMFAGSSVTGKSWVWDETAESGAYGYGGYGYSYVPDWGSNMPGETSDGGLFVNPDDEMVFDLDGGANFTQGDDTLVEVNLKNAPSALAFFIRLSLKDAQGDLFTPVFWQDNYFSIAPGDTRTIQCIIPQSAKLTSPATLTVSGWNVPEKKVSLSLEEKK